MAAITNYDTLTAAIDSWDERTHDSDELIGLAEAEFRLYLGPNYARETSATLTFALGLASLPSGYLRTLSLTHPTGGPLKATSWDGLNEYNPLEVSGIPALFAVSGTQIKTAPLFDGTADLAYEGTLAGLTNLNQTNWLITNAPQAYLSMCLSMAKAKFEDYDGAATLKQQALTTLRDLGIQSTVAQYGRAAARIPGCTP